MIWRLAAAVVLRLRALAWNIVYRSYRARYDIDPSFNFNGEGIQLFGDGTIELGSTSYIGSHSSIQAAAGQRVRIGRLCRISHNVRIYTSTSNADVSFLTDADRIESGSVTIGDGAWVGTNVYIGPGITIGNNAIVGANAVVSRDVPEGEIWGGVPARFIRRKQPGGVQ